MDWIAIIYAAGALASALAAVLAWAAKLRWAKEYAAAKDEIIRAKESEIAALNAQIKMLNELTPMKIREYFLSVKTQLEEYIEHLQQRIKALESELSKLSTAVQGTRAEQIIILKAEKSKLEDDLKKLKDNQKQVNEFANHVIKFYGAEALANIYSLNEFMERQAKAKDKTNHGNQDF